MTISKNKTLRCVVNSTLLISLSMPLTACGRVSFNSCPPVVEYSRAIQTEAAQELLALNPHDPLRLMMNDYKRERDELRACHVD